MRLREIVKKVPRTVRSNAKVAAARSEMELAGSHHLPVVDGGSVVGVVSDRDLRNVAADVTVGELMETKVVTATPDTTVREAANLLRGNIIGCLPVLDQGRLVGIVTTSDLLTLIGKGAERPVAESKRWTLPKRGQRRKAFVPNGRV
jgi:acetoin utilization protein AcuB